MLVVFPVNENGKMVNHFIVQLTVNILTFQQKNKFVEICQDYIQSP